MVGTTSRFHRRPLRAILDTGLWFVMGAFLVSVFMPYIDAVTTKDLSGSVPPIIGGLVTAAVGWLKAA